MSLFFMFGSQSAPAVDPIIDRHVANTFIPGHSTGSGTATSTGVAINYSITLVNNSGTTMNSASLVFAGWRLTTTGTAAVGNDVPVSATVEYPIGGTTTNMTAGGNTTITVANNTETVTDDVTLATPIPSGASFKVNLTGTPANGLTYLTQYSASSVTIPGLGLVGVRTRALTSLFKKECPFMVGDSIATNNGGALTTAALYLGCPSIHGSISGTTAQTYGASSAANFTRQAALAAACGATMFVSDFGTNDFGALTTLANLQTYLSNMKAKAAAVGVRFAQTTMTPRTTRVTPTCSSVTSSGTTMTVEVPDATQFVAGRPYLMAGATQTEYNGMWMCTAVDTGTNTLTFLFGGSGTSPATGTITLGGGYGNTTAGWSSAELQAPYTAGGTTTAYNAGSGSDRGQFNAWIRAGAFDSYIDWGDACEATRDSGRWAVGGEKTELLTTQTNTVSSVINTSRFVCNFSGGTNTMASGTVQFITGSNAGLRRAGSGNINGDITCTAAFTNAITVGDTVYNTPQSNSATDDGLHPRVATGSLSTSPYRGGQALIVNKTVAWLQGRLA